MISVSSLYKNVAILASGSLLTVLIGLISSKVWALLGGPSALAEQGLLVGLLGLGTAVSAFGLGSGLVRFGAAAITTGDFERIAALRRAAWILQGVFWIISVMVMLIFYSPIGSWSLGRTNAFRDIGIVSVALGFVLSTAMHTSTLNAYQRVSKLARTNVIVILVSNLSGTLVLWRFGVSGVIWSVLIASMAGWLAARHVVKGEIGPTISVSRDQVVAAAKTLLRFGAPFTLSLVAGQIVQQLLPSLVLHELGRDEVGYFRVASSFTVVYMGFLTSAMAQDYFPRLSALRSDVEVREVLNQQHRLVMALCLPIIYGLIWLALVIVPILSSSSFLPSVAVLEWLLVGSVLKLSSWVMAFVVLARAGSGWYLLTEVSAGVVSLLANLWGMRTFGLPGLGIASVMTYAAYWLVVALVLRLRFRITLDLSGFLWVWLSFLAALIMVVSMSQFSLTSRIWIGIAVILVMSSVSLVSLRSNQIQRIANQT